MKTLRQSGDGTRINHKFYVALYFRLDSLTKVMRLGIDIIDGILILFREPKYEIRTCAEQLVSTLII